MKPAESDLQFAVSLSGEERLALIKTCHVMQKAALANPAVTDRVSMLLLDRLMSVVPPMSGAPMAVLALMMRRYADDIAETMAERGLTAPAVLASLAQFALDYQVTGRTASNPGSARHLKVVR